MPPVQRRSYSSTKVEGRNSALDGKGLFAKQHISKDELLIDFSSGPGKFVSLKETDVLYDKGYDYMIQVDAMRDIQPGEEITFDYAMTESSDYSMPCKCGREYCRGIITGNDWKNGKLQQKYAGYFSEYLNKKIFQDILQKLENTFGIAGNDRRLNYQAVTTGGESSFKPDLAD